MTRSIFVRGPVCRGPIPTPLSTAISYPMKRSISAAVLSGSSRAGKWLTLSSRFTENHGFADENVSCAARNSGTRGCENKCRMFGFGSIPESARRGFRAARSGP